MLLFEKKFCKTIAFSADLFLNTFKINKKNNISQNIIVFYIT